MNENLPVPAPVPEAPAAPVPAAKPKNRPAVRPPDVDWDFRLHSGEALDGLRTALRELLRLEAKYVADVLKSPGRRLSGERLLMAGAPVDPNDAFASAEVANLEREVRADLEALLMEKADEALDAATCEPKSAVERVRGIFAGLAVIAGNRRDPRASGARVALRRCFVVLDESKVDFDRLFRREGHRIAIRRAHSDQDGNPSGLGRFYA